MLEEALGGHEELVLAEATRLPARGHLSAVDDTRCAGTAGLVVRILSALEGGLDGVEITADATTVGLLLVLILRAILIASGI